MEELRVQLVEGAPVEDVMRDLGARPWVHGVWATWERTSAGAAITVHSRPYVRVGGEVLPPSLGDLEADMLEVLLAEPGPHRPGELHALLLARHPGPWGGANVRDVYRRLADKLEGTPVELLRVRGRYGLARLTRRGA